MAEKIRTVSLKTGMPTVEEARARLNSELARARQAGVVAMKIIHGYGSSGVGGALQTAIRNSLRKRRKEKKIRSYIAGERWSVFEETAQFILQECPELGRDADLNNANEGITVVLL